MSYQLNNQTIAPGPGTYCSKSFIIEAAKHSFGKSKRTNEIKLSESPGPGKYKIPTLIGNEGVSPSFIGRAKSLSEGVKMRCPGPGSYNPTYNWKTINVTYAI